MEKNMMSIEIYDANDRVLKSFDFDDVLSVMVKALRAKYAFMTYLEDVYVDGALLKTPSSTDYREYEDYYNAAIVASEGVWESIEGPVAKVVDALKASELISMMAESLRSLMRLMNYLADSYFCGMIKCQPTWDGDDLFALNFNAVFEETREAFDYMEELLMLD
jgi:hypothetical protein